MELFGLANDMGLLDESSKNDCTIKYTMNVDYYDLEHDECVNGDFDVEIDVFNNVRFDRVLPKGSLVDGVTFYRNDEYMFHIENPYSATAILKYVHVQMLTRGATEEEIDYIREQIRRDCLGWVDEEIDKGFVIKMIEKYVSFDF